MSNFANLDLTITEKVAQIEMHRAPSNILEFEMMTELAQALDQVSECSVLLLSSALPHFSMGVDIKVHTPDKVPEMLEKFHAVIRRIYHFGGVSLCLLHGYALGGGLELALPCDFLFAEKESRLGFPEIRLACFPPVAAVLLPHTIGRRGYPLLFTGETIPASEALAMGIVDKIFDKENRDSFLKDFLQKNSAYSYDALHSLKKVIRNSSGFDFDEELAYAEKVYIQELLQSPDMAEGINAFLQKRPAKYRR